MQGGTTQPPFVLLALTCHGGWRTAAWSFISSPSAQIQSCYKEVLQSMKFHIFTVRGYCGLPTCCLSVPHQWQGTAQRRHFKGPSILLCLHSCDSHVAPNPKISEYLVLCWSPDNLSYVPLCPLELLFQQCLGSSSVPNFKFSSINSGTITSETINSVIVMVTSS